MKEDVTCIGGIATLYNDGQHSCIILPRSWNGKRVFCILKDQWDKMRQQQEKEDTKMIGLFAKTLVNHNRGGGERTCKK